MSKKDTSFTKFWWTLLTSVSFISFLNPAVAQVQPTISTSTSTFSKSYTKPQSVSMSTSSGAIFFTTNGSDPDNSSTPYSSPITVEVPTQIKAISYLTGNYSAVTTMFLDVDPTLDPILQPGLQLRLRSDFGVVSGSGSPVVDTWTDLSGEGNDAVGTSTTRPLVSADAINSLPTVSFNGSTQFLSLPSGFANFSKTLIKVSNSPPVSSGTQRITVNGNNADYASSTSSTDATIATGLASAINSLSLAGVSATASGDLIEIAAPAATTFVTTPGQNILMQMQGPGATIFAVTSPDSLTANARILDFGQAGSGNNINCQISSSGSNGQFSVYSATTGSNVQSATALVQGVFHLLGAAQSEGTANGTATFYLNGIPGTASSTMNNIPNTTRTSNFIGKDSSGGNFYSGRISEILVYSTKLTNAQIGAVSASLSQKYQINYQTAESPLFSVPPGTLTKPTQVSIRVQPGAQTYITTDNSTPTSSSTPYAGEPLTINYTQTIKAVSILNGVSSQIAVATYTLDASLWPAPSSGDMTAPTINLDLPVPSI
ncbi:MAG: chitobiase/beta-hexosaminidase C-terminal domain-containing protein [Candidatus Obscuribacterales bacterium]|nr:chitobiase/beta-hexosaminidase C-terminal domain-containing protein [Candidatus Obscuribacterales bacterium]